MAARAVVVERRRRMARSFRMERKCTAAARLRPIIGVDRYVIVAEVGGENDCAGGGAAEGENDGGAVACENLRRPFLAIDPRLPIDDELHLTGEKSGAADVEKRAPAAEGGQHAAPPRV